MSNYRPAYGPSVEKRKEMFDEKKKVLQESLDLLYQKHSKLFPNSWAMSAYELRRDIDSRTPRVRKLTRDFEPKTPPRGTAINGFIPFRKYMKTKGMDQEEIVKAWKETTRGEKEDWKRRHAYALVREGLERQMEPLRTRLKDLQTRHNQLIENRLENSSKRTHRRLASDDQAELFLTYEQFCQDLNSERLLPELRGMAKALGIKGYSKLRKKELCDAIAVFLTFWKGMPHLNPETIADLMEFAGNNQ